MEDLTDMGPDEIGTLTRGIVQRMLDRIFDMDVPDNGHDPITWGVAYRQLRMTEELLALARQVCTARFCEQVPPDEVIVLPDGLGIAVHKRGRQAGRKPDNDQLRNNVRRGLIDRAVTVTTVTPDEAAQMLSLVEEVISFNVGNTKSSGMKVLGLDKNDFYHESGDIVSSLVITQPEDMRWD